MLYKKYSLGHFNHRMLSFACCTENDSGGASNFPYSQPDIGAIVTAGINQFPLLPSSVSSRAPICLLVMIVVQCDLGRGRN